MGLTGSYAYFLPVHALYQIVSIKLCHNVTHKQHRAGDKCGKKQSENDCLPYENSRLAVEHLIARRYQRFLYGKIVFNSCKYIAR